MSDFNITRIEFAEASKLLKVISQVADRDKKLSLGSPFSYIYLEQIEDFKSILISYINGDGWLAAECDSVGVIGSSYLFDAEDLLSRLSILSSVSNEAGLRFYQTKQSQMKVEILIPEKENLKKKKRSSNNILISTYNGDCSDFTDSYLKELEVEAESCVTVAPRLNFFSLCSIINSFSNLKVDTDSRPLWFHSFDGSLWISSTAKICSNSGTCMSSIRVGPTSSSFDFGLIGRQLFKSLYLFSHEVSFYPLPSRLILKSSTSNTAVLNRIPPLYSLPLTKGAPLTTLPTTQRSQHLSLICTRVFSLKELLRAVYLSKPKQNANNQELCLTVNEPTLIISKQSDSKLLERSEVSIFSSLLSIGDWFSISVHYEMLVSSLKALSEYCNFCKKLNSSDTSFYSPDTFSDQLDFEDLSSSTLKDQDHEFTVNCSIYSINNKSHDNYTLMLTPTSNAIITPYQAESFVVTILVKSNQTTLSFNDD
jgi:hypothetical protein